MRSILAPETRRIADLDAFPTERAELVEAWVRAGEPLSEALRVSEWGIFPVRGGAVETGSLVQGQMVDGVGDEDPETFFPLTREMFFRHGTFAWATDSPWNDFKLPKVGIMSKVVLQFDGTVVVGTANQTTRELWPYGLLSSVQLSVSGSDDHFSCRGIALKALEHARYPGLAAGMTDDVVGPGIGTGLTLAVGNIPVRLTWEIPIAFDETSLVGALLAAGQSMEVALRGRNAALADVCTVNTGGGTTTLTGTWTVAVQHYDIPVNPRTGRRVFPDLSMIHTFNESSKDFAGAGKVRQDFLRLDGYLQRVFVQQLRDTAAPITIYDPFATADLTSYALELTGQKSNYRYEPAQYLGSQNVRDYGSKVPYRFACLDLARNNPSRDVINLANLTELVWMSEMLAAPTGGRGRQYIVQETLQRA